MSPDPMRELVDRLMEVFRDSPTRITLSNPRTRSETLGPARMFRLDNPQSPTTGTPRFRMETQRGAQMFHETMTQDEALKRCEQLLGNTYRQLNAVGTTHRFEIKLSKRGRVLFTASASSCDDGAHSPGEPHDHVKNRILDADMPIQVLHKLGICTSDGKVRSSGQAKYRQISRFIEMVDDAVSHYQRDHIEVIDFGCGKSYLTFVIHHYLTRIRGLDAHTTGIDLKRSVIEDCRKTADEFGYKGMEFVCGDIVGYQPDTSPDLVVTLHACDIATDHALASAISWGAEIIMSVPCCQHELARQMSDATLPILSRHGIIRERTAALMTDAIRANLLIACGYRTQLLEFVDMEHTPKNLLIRAVRTTLPLESRRRARAEADEIIAGFGFDPTIYALLAHELESLEEGGVSADGES